jgi:beta-lactamase regulating signal transducer with metallopeptidase domain
MNEAWGVTVSEWAGVWANAMLRSSWQGGVVIVLVWAVIRVLPVLSPRVRCWLWRIAYLKLLAALFWAPSVELPLFPVRTGVHLIGNTASRRSTSAPLFPPREDEGKAGASLTVAQRGPAPDPLSGLLVFWLAGMAWCSTRVLRDRRAALRVRYECETVRGDGLIADCQALCCRLGLRQRPRLLVGNETISPLILDALHPTLILPSSLVAQCAPKELQLMLAHELAHLKRQDLRWGWLAALAHSFFYFHPLVWLANQECRLAQEMACDELAVLATRAPVGEYGELLVKVAAQHRRRRQLGLAAVGAYESPQTLRRRLLAMQYLPRTSQRQFLLSGWLLVAVGTALLVPWKVIAQSAPTRHQDLRDEHVRPRNDRHLSLGSSSRVKETYARQPSPKSIYLHSTVFANGTGRFSPRPDLLEIRTDLDLENVSLREALRRIFAQVKQEYVVDHRIPEEQRITLRGRRQMLFEVLDDLIRQVGGGWMQEIRNGEPTIRIGRDLFMTMHVGPVEPPGGEKFRAQAADPPSPGSQAGP